MSNSRNTLSMSHKMKALRTEFRNSIIKTLTVSITKIGVAE